MTEISDADRSWRLLIAYSHPLMEGDTETDN